MKVKVLIITALALAMSAVSFGQNSFTVDAGDGGTGNLVLEPCELGGGMPFMEVLKERKSNRDFQPAEIESRLLSGLLWAANGINRPGENKRTAPSSRNSQEIDIYVLTNNGVYLYMPEDQQVKKVRSGDSRKTVIKSDKEMNAPIVLLLVANYDKMKGYETADRDFYAPFDCGYVSQNIYLYCASEHLRTVAMGNIDRVAAAKILGLKNGKVMLAHPVSMD